jgi:hypothetical protein
MAQVRLVSDGTATGTKIFDMEGREITGWSRVAFNCRDRGASKVYVEFDVARADLVGIGPDQLPEGALKP